MGITVIVVLALIVIAALSVYAFNLQRQVWDQEKARKVQEQALEKESLEQRQRINRSIQIIAQGVGESQLSLTEASIRIKVLLDSLGVNEGVAADYQAFYDLALATDHIPILAQWKALTDKEQRQFERERIKLEEQYGEAVLAAAKRIKGQSF